MLNLRGVKESGAFFAIPVYFFILTIYIMIGYAIFQAVTGQRAAGGERELDDRR